MKPSQPIQISRCVITERKWGQLTYFLFSFNSCVSQQFTGVCTSGMAARHLSCKNLQSECLLCMTLAWSSSINPALLWSYKTINAAMRCRTSWTRSRETTLHNHNSAQCTSTGTRLWWGLYAAAAAAQRHFRVCVYTMAALGSRMLHALQLYL